MSALINISFALLADPFQMMLKSLLGYQSGVIGEATESHVQKKLYENGINKSLQSNFSVIIKVLNLGFVQQSFAGCNCTLSLGLL